MSYLPDILIAIGWLGIVAGLAMVSIPVALVVGGLLLLVGGALLARHNGAPLPNPTDTAGG